MKNSLLIYRRLRSAQYISFFVGVFLIIFSLPTLFFDNTRFYQSYLFAYLFWLELTLGSMAMLLLWLLTGGAFGAVTRQILASSMRTIYVMALLFLPIFANVQKIYPWADSAKLKSAAFTHKAIYYNFIFFSGRVFVYFISWIIIAYFLDHFLRKQDSLERYEQLRKFSAGALIFLGLSITWASVDLQMSLDFPWYSTIYGMIFAVGQAFGAWAFTILICKLLLNFHEDRIFLTPKIDLDLGNMLLTLVILWAYLSFMQYLIVWSANLPEEVTWFSKRINHGWQWLLCFIFLFQFAAPFSALLFRDVKYRKKAMMVLAFSILFVRILDRYWMVMPAFRAEAISVSYVDITLCFGLGGIWIALFLWNLNQGAYFAVGDPHWPQAKKALSHA